MPNYVINSVKMTGSQSEIAEICEMLTCRKFDSEEAIDFNNVVKMPESMNLVCGGSDKWYVAAYIQSLPEKDRLGLAQKLLIDGFLKNYYQKYSDAFTKKIPEDVLSRMQEKFREEYKDIQPSSVEEVGKTYIDNILNYGADTWYDWCSQNWGSKWGAMQSYINDDNFGFDTAWSAALPVTKKLSEMFPDVEFSHEYADEDIGSNCGRFKFKSGEITEQYLPEGDEAVLYACDMWGYDPEEYGVCSDEMDIDTVIQDATAQSELVNDNNTSKEEEYTI